MKIRENVPSMRILSANRQARANEWLDFFASLRKEKEERVHSWQQARSE